MKTLMALAAALVCSSALAHEGMHGPGAEHDADENGSLSLKEFTAYLQATKQDVSKAAETFAALDVNKDGKLSGGEFARGTQAKPK
jgi:Ca2+-binding EF-hand superfamily protein